VLERARLGLCAADKPDLLGIKPARWRRVDWTGRGVTGDDSSSGLGDRSESCKSGGGGVLSKLSSEGGDRQGKREEGADDLSVIPSIVAIDELDLAII
jgi:hypothetical protein